MIMPLVAGAAQISRRAVGTAVFGGMIAASPIGIFLVPMLHGHYNDLHERLKGRFSRHAGQPNASVHHV